jgi:integrase
MFAWAMKQGLAEENPAVAVARVVEPKARERTLTGEELRAIWEATEGPGDVNAIVRLLMLTGQRREEVAAMTWDEVDEAKALWSIPGERTKNHRPHDVPLSGQALGIIQAVPHRAGRALLFGERKGGFSGWSKGKERLDQRIALGRAKAAGIEEPNTKALSRFALKPWRLHDLRRTVVTGMAEIGVQPHVIEAVVNHISGHKAGVAGVYNRATYANEKRQALDRWAEWLAATVEGKSSVVVPLKRA